MVCRDRLGDTPKPPAGECPCTPFVGEVVGYLGDTPKPPAGRPLHPSAKPPAGISLHYSLEPPAGRPLHPSGAEVG